MFSHAQDDLNLWTDDMYWKVTEAGDSYGAFLNSIGWGHPHPFGVGKTKMVGAFHFKTYLQGRQLGQITSTTSKMTIKDR